MIHAPDSSGRLRPQGILLLLTTTVLWSTGPIFVKYLTTYYDVWTQNAFRYLCATAALLAWMAWTGGLREPLTRDQWHKLILVSFVNILLQTAFAAMFYFIYPAVAILVVRLNIIFVAVLSFVIFHDERRVIRSPYFLIGAALTLGGVVPVVVGTDPELLAYLQTSDLDFWIGVTLAISYALFLAMYSLAIKHAVRDIPAQVSFTHVSWMTTLGLCIPMFLSGGVTDLWRQPSLGLWVMVVSALLCMVIGHTAFYKALREVKAVVSMSVMQLVPILTCIYSAILFGDRLTGIQLIGGALVILGAWLASLAQARTEETSSTAEKPRPQKMPK